VAGIDPDQWRERAAEIRAAAERMRNPEARIVMLEAAMVCDRIATLIAPRAGAVRPPRKPPATH